MAKNERILIVDDDADLVEVIAEILSLYNYQVTTLTGLSGLKEALAENEFQLIITDLHLGRESGREIVEAIGRRERPIPVLIMTGFPENEEVKNLLYRDYVSGLLIKPFAESDIVSNVKLAIDNVHSVTHKKVAPFLAAPLSIIQVDTDLEFDVFLKIYEGKYVKIAHHNSRLTQDKVEALAAKKIQSIYIPYDQFPETLKQNIDYLRHSREQGKNLGARDKELLFMSGRPITETFRSLNLDESTFKSVEEYVGICLHFASKFELLFSDLREVQKNSPERYFRIISTMFLGCAYALLTEKFSKDEVLAIGLGSLLMNIGESQLSEALFVQSYATLSMAERREFQKHPEKGVSLLKEIPSVADSVLTVVEQHHERYDGKGFPKQLQGREIDPLASIVRGSEELSLCLYPHLDHEIDVPTGLERFCATAEGQISAKLMSNFHEVFTTLDKVSGG